MSHIDFLNDTIVNWDFLFFSPYFLLCLKYHIGIPGQWSYKVNMKIILFSTLVLRKNNGPNALNDKCKLTSWQIGHVKKASVRTKQLYVELLVKGSASDRMMMSQGILQAIKKLHTWGEKRLMWLLQMRR